ncbi:nucleotide-binding alpha-beta plait domain-containing protein [Tanacetum coccineum]
MYNQIKQNITPHVHLNMRGSISIKNKQYMGIFRSKEDDLEKIYVSVFINNIPDSYSAKDLFNACKQYGHVVDSFIPNKRSKAGKRFSFVKFINVFNEERLVDNLGISSPNFANGGSFLDVLDGLVRVGQSMGYEMDGCLKDLENIIGNHGDSGFPK